MLSLLGPCWNGSGVPVPCISSSSCYSISFIPSCDIDDVALGCGACCVLLFILEVMLRQHFRHDGDSLSGAHLFRDACTLGGGRSRAQEGRGIVSETCKTSISVLINNITSYRFSCSSFVSANDWTVRHSQQLCHQLGTTSDHKVINM